MNQTKKKQSGYLTVEILVSLFIIVILVSIGAMILNISNASRSRAINFDRANAIAFAKIQEYELKSFGDIPNGTSGANFEIEDFSAEVLGMPDNRYTDATGKVYSQAESGSLKKLWLELEYEFGVQNFTIEYATYIQLGGVGR